MGVSLTNSDIQAAANSIETVLGGKGLDRILPALIRARHLLRPLLQQMEEERLALLGQHAETVDGHLVPDEAGGPKWLDDAHNAAGQAALRAFAVRSVEVAGTFLRIAYATDLPRDKSGNLVIDGTHIANLSFLIDGIPGMEESDGE